jgi:hypothetical protein
MFHQFWSSSETCYVSKSPSTGQLEVRSHTHYVLRLSVSLPYLLYHYYIFLLQSPMRPETVDEDPNQHGRLPNIIIQLPLMQDLMANKIQMLPVHQRQKFQAKLIDYDLEVGKVFATIKQCLNNIGTK